MSISLRHLYRLQQVDLTVAEVLEQLERLKKEVLPEENQYASLERQLNEYNNQKEKTRKQQRIDELELASLQAEKKKIETQLYGGKTTNPKELSQWQRDLEILNSKINIREEKVLEALIKIEELDKEIKPYSEMLKDIQSKLSNAKVEKENELNRIKSIIDECKEKRNKILPNIDEDIFPVYERLLKKKGGIAVTKIQNDICGGCFVHLPEGVVKRVQNRELQHCPQCGRILYWEPEMSASDAQYLGEGTKNNK